MKAPRVTATMIRAWGMSKPHAVAVRIQRDGMVMVQGWVPRTFEFGWYFLGQRDDIAHNLPLRARDGDPVAAAILSSSAAP